MGRLMLHVLLSLAQFEREVGAERVRDKIAASKAKGMWMGGSIPLGYDVIEKKFIINDLEADTLRAIFAAFVRIRSVQGTLRWARREGLRTKLRQRLGGTVGGKEFEYGERLAKLFGRSTERYKRLLRMSYLSPTTVSAIVGGEHPAHLTSNYLQHLDGLPLSWADQETTLLR